jgi:hypothetical protein
MSVPLFLADLFETGRVTVALRLDETSDDSLDAVLRPAESVVRLNLAGEAPEFLLPAARWAARIFYGSCHFLVCRDVEPKVIAAFFEQPNPTPSSPAAHYSADLVFQYLPDLIAMARGVALDDPLLEHLLSLARAWPLSSVSVPDCGQVEIGGFIEHPALRQLYIDRIVARTDLARLADPRATQAARETLGAFPELCEPVSKHLALAGPPAV